MLQRNKNLVIITSVLPLLAILFGLFVWNQLPEQIATHFDSDGIPNGYNSRAFVVFGIPFFMFVIQLVLAVVVANDPKKQNISDKLYRGMLWFCPLITLFMMYSIYEYALSDHSQSMAAEPLSSALVYGLLGILLIIVGNYLPKTKQNFTIGIKLPWTLSSTENWNRTHRMAGWLWIAGGLIILCNALIQSSILMIVVFAVIVIVPILYSFVSYMKEERK